MINQASAISSLLDFLFAGLGDIVAQNPLLSDEMHPEDAPESFAAVLSALQLQADKKLPMEETIEEDGDAILGGDAPPISAATVASKPMSSVPGDEKAPVPTSDATAASTEAMRTVSGLPMGVGFEDSSGKPPRQLPVYSGMPLIRNAKDNPRPAAMGPSASVASESSGAGSIQGIASAESVITEVQNPAPPMMMGASLELHDPGIQEAAVHREAGSTELVRQDAAESEWHSFSRMRSEEFLRPVPITPGASTESSLDAPKPMVGEIQSMDLQARSAEEITEDILEDLPSVQTDPETRIKVVSENRPAASSFFQSQKILVKDLGGQSLLRMHEQQAGKEQAITAEPVADILSSGESIAPSPLQQSVASTAAPNPETLAVAASGKVLDTAANVSKEDPGSMRVDTDPEATQSAQTTEAAVPVRRDDPSGDEPEKFPLPERTQEMSEVAAIRPTPRIQSSGEIIAPARDMETLTAIQRQIADGVVRAARDALLESTRKSTATVSIQPRGLGKVDIQVDLMGNNQVQVQLVTESEDIRNHLEAEADDLIEALLAHRIEVSNLEIRGSSTEMSRQFENLTEKFDDAETRKSIEEERKPRDEEKEDPEDPSSSPQHEEFRLDMQA